MCVCWNSNPGEAKGGKIGEQFDLLKSWVRHCHVRDLTKNDYPWQELMTCLKAIKYDGYTMLELTSKGDALELLKAQRAAWEKLVS